MGMELKQKKYFIFFFVLILSVYFSYFVYHLNDENLTELALEWQSENEFKASSSFSEINNFKLPEDLKNFEEACENSDQKKYVKEFLVAWEKWSSANKDLKIKILKIFVESPHRFSQSGLSSFIEDFNKFYKSTEVFDYQICELKLKGSNQEANQLQSQFVFNVLSQLRVPQPAKYQLWALQTLNIYLAEEKILTQDLNLNNSLKAQISTINQEELFKKSKQYSFQVIFNSFKNLKSKGWLDFTTWLPAILIHQNKLANQMANFELNQSYPKASPQAHWTHVSNLSTLYFNLYVSLLEEPWSKIPEELTVLENTTRP